MGPKLHPESFGTCGHTVRSRTLSPKAGGREDTRSRAVGTLMDSWPEFGEEVPGRGYKRVLTGHAVMFWVQRLMLELSSRKCCNAAAFHPSRDAGPVPPGRPCQTGSGPQAHLDSTLVCIPRICLDTPLLDTPHPGVFHNSN